MPSYKFSEKINEEIFAGLCILFLVLLAVAIWIYGNRNAPEVTGQQDVSGISMEEKQRILSEAETRGPSAEEKTMILSEESQSETGLSAGEKIQLLAGMSVSEQ